MYNPLKFSTDSVVDDDGNHIKYQRDKYAYAEANRKWLVIK